jgi:hypothetical protein
MPDANGVRRQIIQCELCVHWFSPEGGIAYDGPMGANWWGADDRGQVWWQGAGLCLLRAPVPSPDADEAPTQWKITHFTGGCGDGQVLDQTLVEPRPVRDVTDSSDLETLPAPDPAGRNNAA